MDIMLIFSLPNKINSNIITSLKIHDSPCLINYIHSHIFLKNGLHVQKASLIVLLF